MPFKILFIGIFLFCTSIANGGEKYHKEIIFEMTWDEFVQYDCYDFDNTGNVWFLDSKHGRVNVINAAKKIVRSVAVPTKNPLQFMKNPNNDFQVNNASNFHIRVDSCNNFVIFTDAFPTKIIEINSFGNVLKEDFLKMERFEDVTFNDGKIYSRPGNNEVLKLIPVECSKKIANQQWNDFTILKVNLYTPCGLEIPGLTKTLDFDIFRKRGPFLKIKNIVRDIRGNIYINLDNMRFLNDPKAIGESYQVTSNTYKYDKHLREMCVIPAMAEQINLNTETLYSVERGKEGKNGDSIIFTRWIKK